MLFAEHRWRSPRRSHVATRLPLERYETGRRGSSSTGGKFTGRLQLAPGHVPPTSWSFPLLRPPKIYCRAESLKSPEPGAIYPMPPGSARNLAVYEGLAASPVRSVVGLVGLVTLLVSHSPSSTSSTQSTGTTSTFIR